MSKSRSRFKRAVATLAELTNFPLFVHMRETGRAVPIGLGVSPAVVAACPLGKRTSARSALHLLFESKRYLEAVAADGSQRFDQQGEPAEAVHEHIRLRARLVLAERAARLEPRATRKGDRHDVRDTSHADTRAQ